MATVTVFLAFLKNEVGVTSLSKITIDVSAAGHAAIDAVFPEVTVQWSLFHVNRAWMSKIRELVRLDSTSLNNQVHREITTDLNALMWEKGQEGFLLSWLEFYNKCEKFISKYLLTSSALRTPQISKPKIYKITTPITFFSVTF